MNNLRYVVWETFVFADRGSDSERTRYNLGIPYIYESTWHWLLPATCQLVQEGLKEACSYRTKDRRLVLDLV
jgi:hypothetical protein